jgi:tetratricopeptide (TPR) repeat protein
VVEISIDFVQKLFEQGEYENAILEIEQLTESNVEVNIIKSKCLEKLGKFQESLELTEFILGNLKHSENHFMIFQAIVTKSSSLLSLGKLDEALITSLSGEYNKFQMEIDIKTGIGFSKQEISNMKNEIIQWLKVQGLVHAKKGNFDLALKSFHSGLEIAKDLLEKTLIFRFYNNIGTVYLNKGEYDQAIEYYNKSLMIVEEINDLDAIATIYLNLGLIFSFKGEYDQAYEYYLNSLTVFKETGNQHAIANTYNNIGIIFTIKGEYDEAVEYYYKYLTLSEKLRKKSDIILAFSNLGDVYNRKGNIFKATTFLLKALSLAEQVGNSTRIITILSTLIQNALQAQDYEIAEQYMSKIKEISSYHENKVIRIYSQLSEALLLKTSKRLNKRIKSQEILAEIIKGESIDYDTTLLAIQHYADLLLEELRIYGEEEVFNEAKSVINKYYVLGQNKNLYPIIIKALMLQSKFSLIEKNISKAEKLLVKALMITKEKNLKRLQKQVELEQELLQDQLGSWKTLNNSVIPLKDRILKTSLEEYINYPVIGPKKYDAFVSYSNKDSEITKKIVYLLELNDIKCWIAPRDINPGIQWASGIIEGIKQSKAFILVFTNNSNKSPHVHREVERAAHYNVKLHLLQVENIEMLPALEYFFSNVHWINLTDLTILENELEQFAELKELW